MRRTRLNVVPPASKEVALARVAGNDVGNDKMTDDDRVMSLTAHVSHHTSYVEDESLRNETRTQRVRRLQEEAKSLAREQIIEFEFLLDAAAKMATEIAEGGDVYSVGAREVCRRMAEELPRVLQTLQVITKKS
jgi:hypothetical protein